MNVQAKKYFGTEAYGKAQGNKDKAKTYCYQYFTSFYSIYLK